MTAFREVLFPPEISLGALGGPGFKTTVLELASGHEKRNINWAKTRAQYDVAYGVKIQEELDAILAFFYVMRGKAYGFRYKDWQDYKINQSIGLTDGATTVFRAFKRYETADGEYYDRELNKLVGPDLGQTMAVSVGVTACTVGTIAGGADAEINYNTGDVTISAALAASTDEAVAIDGQFHVPARFDVDEVRTTLEAYGIYSWGQIPLVELRLDV